MSSEKIRVKVNTGMLGAAAGSVVDLVLTPLVQAAIDDQRLTVSEQPAGAEPPELKGAALDQALRDRQLPLTGSAAEKRARLAEAPGSSGSEPDPSAPDLAVGAPVEGRVPEGSPAVPEPPAVVAEPGAPVVEAPPTDRV